MAKPRTTDGSRIRFPYTFQRNGRIGRIKKWSDEKFGTYFMFAVQKKRNSFGTFEAAFKYLESEFTKIDSDQANSLALNPSNGDVRRYSELEHLLRVEGEEATLREAVAFYLANHRGKRLHPTSFDAASEAFMKAQRACRAHVAARAPSLVESRPTTATIAASPTFNYVGAASATRLAMRPLPPHHQLGIIRR